MRHLSIGSGWAPRRAHATIDAFVVPDRDDVRRLWRGGGDRSRHWASGTAGLELECPEVATNRDRLGAGGHQLRMFYRGSLGHGLRVLENSTTRAGIVAF